MCYRGAKAAGSGLSTLFWLLQWILTGSLTNASYDACDKSYYVDPHTSDSFTYGYTGPWQFSFCFSTAPNYIVALNCDKVEMMMFTGWCRDTLNVTTTGNRRDGQIYCHPFQEEGPTIIMKIFSVDGRGNLRCQFKSEPANENIDPQANCRCGYSGDFRTKIVGGTNAGPHKFTSMASIVSKGGKLLHGATIISDRLALTAAHGIIDKKAAAFNLFVGVYKMSEKHLGQKYQIKRFVPNPDFQKGQHRADIALIETTTTMRFNRNMGPACLPYKYENVNLYYEDVIISGWGSVAFGDRYSDTLLEATVKVQYPESCMMYRDFEGGSMICSYAPHKDACQGDSGGPVYYRDPESGHLFLVGITSAGVICGREPSISTRVATYLDWIHNTYPGESEKFCVQL